VSDTAHLSHRQTLALWAIDQLEEHLGSDWARLAFDDDGLRQTLVWAGAHADATLFLLELALRLEQLKTTPGFAKARDQLRADVRYAVAGHTQLQLETAALSLAHRARVALEVTNPGLRNPVDLVIETPRGPMPAEARVLHVDEAFRDLMDVSDQLSMARLQAELRYKVSLHVIANAVPEHLDAALASIESAAADARATSEQVHRDTAGLEITATPGDEPALSGLVGPPADRELWRRVRAALQDKAGKRYADRATWVRFDSRNGLWQLTPWARLPLQDKAAVMIDQVFADLRAYDVAGVVLTSGCLRPQGPFEAELWREATTGSIALRTALSVGRTREILILPLDERHADEAEWWLTLYAQTEPRWLDTSLQKLGLPAFDVATN
jgi:hypothetical protein